MEDRVVINDENTQPSEKTAAEERVAQREEEIGQLTTQIEGMEREKPLEKIKDMFKKHGVTLTAIVLAASVTIGSVIGVIKNALTKTGETVGNGLKEIGKKNSFTSARAARLDRFAGLPEDLQAIASHVAKNAAGRPWARFHGRCHKRDGKSQNIYSPLAHGNSSRPGYH